MKIEKIKTKTKIHKTREKKLLLLYKKVTYFHAKLNAAKKLEAFPQYF